MGYIPVDAKWYLADIVEQIAVEGDSRYVIHTNRVLIRAESPDDAYTKAVELGTAGEVAYENPEGKTVTITYRGLRDLNVIHDKLEHGAELTYSEEIETDEAAIDQYISSREQLGVFAPCGPSPGPDYRAKDVVERLQALMGDGQPVLRYAQNHTTRVSPSSTK